MTLFTIENSGGNVPPGTYQATFSSLEEIETQKGLALRWEFKSDDGKTISGLTDAEKPTTKNKLGRWLAGIAKAPLQAGVQVDPEKYIGKRYILIVSPHETKGSDLTTFSMLA